MRLPVHCCCRSIGFDLWNWFWTAKNVYVTWNRGTLFLSQKFAYSIWFGRMIPHEGIHLNALIEWICLWNLSEFCCFTIAASWISNCCTAHFLEIVSIETTVCKGLINLTRWWRGFPSLLFSFCIISVNIFDLIRDISLRDVLLCMSFSEIHLRCLFCIWLIQFLIIWRN